ncbi:MAG TPA: HD domain-containing phosphohydrolase [Pyrinomonadaceae bacterium]|nr:HD domain-containing phosphohydrolase [Pyrinomonadaceae bacterium]
MAEQNATVSGSNTIYPTTLTIVSLALWVAAGVSFFAEYAWREQLSVLALLPLVIVMGMFPNTLPLPSALKLSRERMNFTLSDALVLLIACRYGFAACVFVAGIEGLTSSRRAVRRLSSNLYSFGMMSLAAAAAAGSLHLVLGYGFGEAARGEHSFPAVAVGMLMASVVHISVNTGVISLLFATRLGVSVMSSWRENFRVAAPLFLPTSAAASLMYIGLQYNALTVVAIGAPILIAIYFGHRRYRDSMQEQLNIIEQAQRERIATMEQAHRETIEALAVTINAKDEVTHEHVLRVQIYAAGVARLLGCSDAEIEALRAGALLHDIGKIAVPDYIINKPGKLTAEEFEKMKVHTLVGAQILGRVGFSYPVVPVVRSHHERWDGKGYPDGLAGEDIPLTARILTVVDCFDAVREDRQYRKGMTRAEAIDYLMGNSGTQYDPRVVGTFITHLPEFEAEIAAHRNTNTPTYGIEPVEQLSEAARRVPPAAGLAEATTNVTPLEAVEFTDAQRAMLAAALGRLREAEGRDEVIASFLASLKAAVPYDSCALTLAPPHADDCIVAQADGRHRDLLSGRRIVTGEGVTGWVLANRQPFYNADPKLDLPPALLARDDSYLTLAACPILHGKELHGAVTLYSATLPKYEATHCQLIEALVALLATELSNVSQSSSPRLTPALPVADGNSQATPVFNIPPAGLTVVAIESDLSH